MKTIRTARIYGRFSSKPQERGDSKRRQLEGAKAYAQKNGITIKAEYFDEAVSGKAGANLEREFGRLLKEAEPGEVILCEALDRLSRQNPFIAGKLIYDLTQRGLTLIAWQEGKEISPENIDSLATQFSVFTGAAVGHSENVRKTKRLRDTTANAIKEAQDQGKQSATLVKYLPECFVWNAAKAVIEVDQDKTDTIKRIFKMFLDGKGSTSICKALNEAKVPTLYKSKNGWREVTIKDVLRNESYAGSLNIKGHHVTCIPQIVPSDTFDKAQLLLQRYAKRSGKLTGRANNLFPGIGVCKHCGCPISVSVTQSRSTNGKTVYGYYCKGAKVNTCKHHNMLNADTVEYLFFMVFFMGQPEAAIGINTAELREKIEATEAKIKRLTVSITNLYDMAEEGDAEAKDRIAKRKEEKADAEQELMRLKGETVEAASVPEVVSKIRYEFSDDARVYDASQLKAKLADNETRIKLRNSLPVLFEKVIFDTTARTVEGVLKPGIHTGTFLKDITVIHIPRLAHTKHNTPPDAAKPSPPKSDLRSKAGTLKR
jgi:DNA invertase Pin-like site-specific DNA recombinase